MELRKKASRYQRFSEQLIRFRWPLLLLAALVLPFFASLDRGISTILGAGEALARAIEAADPSAVTTVWPWLAMWGALALLRSWRAGLGSALWTLLGPLLLFPVLWGLEGADSVILPILGGGLLLCLLFAIFGRHIALLAPAPIALLLVWALGLLPSHPPLVSALILGWLLGDGIYLSIALGTLLRKHNKAGALVQHLRQSGPATAMVATVFAGAWGLQHAGLWTLHTQELPEVAAIYLGASYLLAPALFSLFAWQRLTKKR